MPLIEIAKIWRLHPPDKPKRKLAELLEAFLQDVKIATAKVAPQRSQITRRRVHRRRIWRALRGPSYPTGNPNLRQRAAPGAPRTKPNHKTAICEFFNWLVQEEHEVVANPAVGIKKRMLPKETKKEIEFLPLDYVMRYLHGPERYAREFVARKVVQLVPGVRADDEMAGFEAGFVLPQTKEVVIPASVAKTEKREVIDGLEENFWAWWSA